jgi:hypothetical protein
MKPSMWIALAIVVLVIVVAASGGSDKPAAKPVAAAAEETATPLPTATPTATPIADPREAARARRADAATLSRRARSALRGGRYTTARRLALQSRRINPTAAARTVLARADAGIARARAAERERRRLARMARDQRTCDGGEKATVRDAGTVPPGCATYAADLAARRTARAAEEKCDPNYEGACLNPDSPDYDCEGGSGDGPDYTGPVRRVGADPFDLDRDGDGYACEAS